MVLEIIIRDRTDVRFLYIMETTNYFFRTKNRKTMCHSKKANYYDTYADFLNTLFNFCRQNEVLKELIKPDAPLFKTKYLRKSPAMAEGLTDKILTVKELLIYRTPK